MRMMRLRMAIRRMRSEVDFSTADAAFKRGAFGVLWGGLLGIWVAMVIGTRESVSQGVSVTVQHGYACYVLNIWELCLYINAKQFHMAGRHMHLRQCQMKVTVVA